MKDVQVPEACSEVEWKQPGTVLYSRYTGNDRGRPERTFKLPCPPCPIGRCRSMTFRTSWFAHLHRAPSKATKDRKKPRSRALMENPGGDVAPTNAAPRTSGDGRPPSGEAPLLRDASACIAGTPSLRGHRRRPQTTKLISLREGTL
jgi:hypothetical protein